MIELKKKSETTIEILFYYTNNQYIILEKQCEILYKKGGTQKLQCEILCKKGGTQKLKY